MSPANDNTPRLISLNETAKQMTFSRTTIMNMAAAGQFCQPVKLGQKRIAFVRAEVMAWIDAKIAARAAA